MIENKIPIVLWAYITSYKWSIDKTTFKLVYGKEVIIPLHFKQYAIDISHVLKFDSGPTRYERLFQLQNLEEEGLTALQHQEAQKKQQKDWNDKNIKFRNISVGDLVLLYDNKIKGKPCKLDTTWLGPYIVEDLNTNGSVQLKTLQGRVLSKVVNGARLKHYHS